MPLWACGDKNLLQKQWVFSGNLLETEECRQMKEKVER
jgi:hypothetical protein